MASPGLRSIRSARGMRSSGLRRCPLRLITTIWAKRQPRMQAIEGLAWLSLGLLILNVFQILFWGRQVQVLVDKLMSRNYAEYVQTNVSGQREDTRMVLPSDEET